MPLSAGNRLTWSKSAPLRRAFLRERGEAFGGFGGAALVGMAFDQAVRGAVAELRPGGFERERLGLRNRLGAVLQDRIDDARTGRFEPGRGHDLMHEADAARFGGIKTLA